MTVVSQHQRVEAAVMKLSVSALGARTGESGGRRRRDEALGCSRRPFYRLGWDGGSWWAASMDSVMVGDETRVPLPRRGGVLGLGKWRGNDMAWVWLRPIARGIAVVPTWIDVSGCLTQGRRKGQAGRAGSGRLDPKADWASLMRGKKMECTGWAEMSRCVIIED
jgi:hypothetical protein